MWMWIWTVIRILALGIIASSLVACGNSGGGHQPDQKQLAEEHNELKNELRSLGEPDSSWTVENLKRYQSKLERLELIERQIQETNSGVGTNIFDDADTAEIADLKEKLKTILTQKVAQTNSNPSAQPTPAQP